MLPTAYDPGSRLKLSQGNDDGGKGAGRSAATRASTGGCRCGGANRARPGASRAIQACIARTAAALQLNGARHDAFQLRGISRPPTSGHGRVLRGSGAFVLKAEARMQGRPAPSASVINLPPMGSAEARELGYACIGGQAMRRLENGWEQVLAREGGWQRCRGG